MSSLENAEEARGVHSWTGSDIGAVRSTNQDAVAGFDDLGLFLLADGMGGGVRGDLASRTAIEAAGNFVRAAEPASRLSPACLVAAVEAAEVRVQEEGARLRADGTTVFGTTIVALAIDVGRGESCWAHVGDSRLYRLRGGDLQLLTADHTRPGLAYQGADSIPLDLPHSSVLIQALGTTDGLDVSSRAAEVRDGDIFMLCSDGVSGSLDPAEIRSGLAGSEPLGERGARLIEQAVEASGKDNTSLVLVEFGTQPACDTSHG